MGDIPESILSLSNGELRKKLIEAGIAPAPLTPTTKRLFQRKLAKTLGQSSLVSQNIRTNLEAKFEPPAEETNDNKLKDNAKSSPDFAKSEAVNVDVYYAIQGSELEGTHVFEEKKAALKFLTKQKKGRLQSFKKREDAELFSNTVIDQPDETKAPTVSEKPNEFSTPKQSELNAFCKLVEAGDQQGLLSHVWKNPRYIVNSGDGPVILKPGARYNALHVAARSNQANVVRSIVTVVQDESFQKLMYKSDVVDDLLITNTSRISHILDLYFNTPDKLLGETPLHFACKLGYPDVVSELASHPLCCKNLKNKSGQTAKDVTCTRQGSNVDKLKITELLKDQFYVPLFRCHDNSHAPVVAPPWIQNQKNLGNLSFQSTDPLDPIHVVSAVAGPMSSDDAKKLHLSWMSPNKKALDGKRISHIRRSDIDRGDERIGRELAEQSNVPWMEYWNFLGTFANFSTKKGLAQLEAFFETRVCENLDQSSLNNSSVFIENDSLGDLCSNMCNLNVNDEGKDEGKSEIPLPLICSSSVDKVWWNLSSTPSQKPKPLSKEFGPGENQMESMKEKLLEMRKQQLQKLNSPSHITNTQNQNFAYNTKTQNSFLDHSLHNLYISTPAQKNPGHVINSFPLQLPDCKGNMQDPSSQHLFIAGESPSKIDTDVVLAIGGTKVNREHFPYTWKWLRSVLSYSEEDRRRWKTPTHTKTLDSPLQSSSKFTPLKSPWPASPLAKPRWKIDDPIIKKALDKELQ